MAVSIAQDFHFDDVHRQYRDHGVLLAKLEI
jgi:hypothetical protein